MGPTTSPDPLIFAYFYMVIPAAVVLYMIISTVIRIITQDLMFRSGVSNPHKAGESKVVERELPPAVKTKAPEKKSSPPGKQPAPPAKKPSTIKSQPQSRSKAKRKRKAR